MATTLGTNLIDPALRKAGIKRLVGSGSSTDQNTEMILAANRLLQAYSIDNHNIYEVSVAEYSLIPSQIIYTIGPGGDLNGRRPLWIKNANLVQPTSPPIYQPIDIYDSRDWSFENIVALPGSWVYAIWYNPKYNTTAPVDCGEIRLLGQPPDGYKLQLFTWDLLQSSFTAVSNEFHFPPGYEEALVNLLALECAELYPHESKITPTLRSSAAKAVLDVQLLNSTLPRIANDAARLGQPSVPYPAAFWNAN